MTNTIIDKAAIVRAISRLTLAMERDFEMLNKADGALGDGDLGVTMTRGMGLVSEQVAELSDDLGLAFLACAKAFTKTSGSSYGTLLSTGFMAVAKALKGQQDIAPTQISALVRLMCEQMQARGKAELGGKTVLDSLDAIAKGTQGKSDIAEVALAAIKAVDESLDRFRDQKATIGRARIFGEKSVGLDDPGMLAMTRIVHAIADR